MSTMTLLATMVVANALAGTRLPELRGDFLSGRACVLPDAARGQVALLAMGFSYDSRYAVEAWTARFRKDFGARPGVTFFEVPMIGGMARLGRWFIDRGMRQGTPRQDYEHVVTVYGDPSEWKRRVAFTDSRHAYLVLLDREGVVRWSGSGSFDEDRYHELFTAVEALAADTEKGAEKGAKKDPALN